MHLACEIGAILVCCAEQEVDEVILVYEAFPQAGLVSSNKFSWTSRVIREVGHVEIPTKNPWTMRF